MTLQQIGPTRATFLQMFTSEAFLDKKKSANAGFKQLTFINIPKYAKCLQCIL